MQDNTIDAAAESAKGLGSQIKEATDQLTKFKDVSETAGNFLRNNLDTLSKFENALIVASRQLGQGASFAKSIEGELGRAVNNVVRMGGGTKDVLETFKSVQETLGRTVFLSQQFYENAFALKQAGVDPKTISTFSQFFDTVGGGFQRATEQQIELVNQAKSYGMNTGQFLSAVGDKLNLVNKFGFPKGVEDLAKMVGQSKMLGDTLKVAEGIADKIMDSPEEAYSMAAQLQTIGGAFAQMGDASKLLYMAQNDLQGLNEEIINASAAMATFNKDTGQFELSTQARLQIRQVAKTFGTDADAITQASLKAAKQTQILSQINPLQGFQNLSEEQKAVLANAAEIGKGGGITIKGEDIRGLSQSSVENLLKQIQGAGSELSNSTDKNVDTLQKNMSATESVNVQTEIFSNSIALSSMKVDNFSSALDNVANTMANVVSKLNDEVTKTIGSPTINTVGDITDKLVNKLEALSQYIAGKSAIPDKVSLDQTKPIEIKLDTSFEINDALRTKLTDVVNRAINEGLSKNTPEMNSYVTSGVPPIPVR
jgi:hypothetical protein